MSLIFLRLLVAFLISHRKMAIKKKLANDSLVFTVQMKNKFIK